mmetsp:Transcript_20596/g.44738  ORF Transcript_20596/g.44738 Transcript_20596/m.44738 type:complete len:87 (-) Transcript_20596:74-334(-)
MGTSSSMITAGRKIPKQTMSEESKRWPVQSPADATFYEQLTNWELPCCYCERAICLGREVVEVGVIFTQMGTIQYQYLEVNASCQR